jgi:hypothetical protein
MTRFLPWHQRHHADVFRRTRKLSPLARSVFNDLLDLFHMGELDRAADNDRAWMNRLELSSWKTWRKARDELVSAGMICVRTGFVLLMPNEDGMQTESKPIANGFNSEAENASDFNERRPSKSPSVSQSACHGDEVSYRSPTHAHERTPARPTAAPPRPKPASPMASPPARHDDDGCEDPPFDLPHKRDWNEATHAAPEFVMSPDEVPY